MLERATGRALLMDFGISRSITAPVSATQGLTRVGEVVGTPEYMSPEQASGDKVDGRSDIYSLGLVALFALTGHPALTGESTQQILVKQLTVLPPPATTLRPDLPASLGAAIDRCVVKQPDARFATAEALVETIDDAKLAAPEIPVPVRLFAQEVSTLGLILTFMLVLLPFLVRAMGTGGSLDAAIPILLLGAIALTRIMQTSSAARRLAILGFAPADVVKGMQAVLAERDAIRDQLRNDRDTQRRRRNTVITASLMPPVAIVLLAFTWARRVEWAPGRYAVGRSGMVMFVSAFIMLGVSIVLFARSPFRAPVGERLFRVVWLGPIGRWFIRYSMRGVARGSSTPSQPSIAAAPPPRGDDRLAALEARLALLENEKREGRH
jgi:serine/threonine-protein kinase